MPKLKSDETLESLANKIQELRELIKCPLCFEILNNPVELKCTHLFCDQCISKNQKLSTITCPICQMKCSRRSKKHNCETESLIQFVHALSNQFQQKFNVNFSSYMESKKSTDKKLTNVVSEQLQDQFDQLLGKTPKKPLKTYDNPRKVDNEKPAGLSGTKEYVIQWLQDSENLFHRISQTQQEITDNNGTSAGDNLVSASQEKRRRTCGGSSSARRQLKRRCKSLGCKELPQKYDRDSNDIREMQIEEFDSMPRGPKMNAENTVVASVPSKDKKRKNVRKEPDVQSSSLSSSWDRNKKITKLIEKMESRPKRLKLEPLNKISPANISKEMSSPLSNFSIGQVEQQVLKPILPVNKLQSNSKEIASTARKQLNVVEYENRPNKSMIKKKSSVGNQELQMICKEESQVKGIVKFRVQSNDLIKKSKENTKVNVCNDSPILLDDDVFIQSTPVMLDPLNETIYLNNDCESFVQHFQHLQKKYEAYKSKENPDPKILQLAHIFSKMKNKFDHVENILKSTNEEKIFAEFETEVFTQTEIKLKNKEVQVAPSMVNQAINTFVKKLRDCEVQTATTLKEQGVQTSPMQRRIVLGDSNTKLNCLNITNCMENKGQRQTDKEMRLTELFEQLEENPCSLEEDKNELSGLELEKIRSILKESPEAGSACRKKLYSQSPIKKIRRQYFSETDEENDTESPLINVFKRDDVSLHFDTENPQDLLTEDVDKHLNDVYDRIEQNYLENRESEDKVTQGKRMQMAIKTHTQQLVEKCDQLIEKTVGKWSNNARSNKASEATTAPEDSLFEEDDDLFNDFHTPAVSTEAVDKSVATQSDEMLQNLHSSLMRLTEIPHSKKVQLKSNVVIQHSIVDDDDVAIIPPSDEEMTPKNSNSGKAPFNRTITPPLDFQDKVAEDGNHHGSIVTTQHLLSISPIPKSAGNLALRTPTVNRTEQRRFIQKVTSTPMVKKQTSIVTFAQSSKSSAQSKRIVASSAKLPTVSCSRLTADQIAFITALKEKKLMAYSNVYTDDVTHLVVSTNEYNCLKDHTIKYVTAVAAGIWIVNFKWVLDSLNNNRIMPEHSYEVLDVTGVEGPKAARLYRTIKPLLKGFKIYVAPPLVCTTQRDLEKIIGLLGGKVVEKVEKLLPREDYISLIITETKSTEETDIYENWLESLRVVTVDIEWLSRSVGQYKLQNLTRFALCSTDGIDEIGYPPELVQQVPYSLTQSNLTM